MTATMTALSKPDGGVRGIATGTSFRRLVAKTLARRRARPFSSPCPPGQALITIESFFPHGLLSLELLSLDVFFTLCCVGKLGERLD